MNMTEPSISDEEIARRAYELWEARGRPESDGSEDWQAAKAELIERRFRRNGKTGRGFLSWWRRVMNKNDSQMSGS